MREQSESKAVGRAPIVVLAVALWLLGALFGALALLLLFEASGGVGLALLSGYSALVALCGGWACLIESRTANPSLLRATGLVLLVLFGVCIGLAFGSVVVRAQAHGAFEGLAVLFGGGAVVTSLLAGACFLYAGPNARDAS